MKAFHGVEQQEHLAASLCTVQVPESGSRIECARVK